MTLFDSSIGVDVTGDDLPVLSEPNDEALRVDAYLSSSRSESG